MHEADLVCGICGAYGGYETAEVCDVRRYGGGRGLCEGPGKRVVGCFLDGLKAFGINADQWTTAAQSGGNGTERQNKGRNISGQHRSLQRKPRLDYGIQCYART